MNKDAFYFPHFSNARNDRKLKRVMKEFQIEGYGIYFMLLETLRDQESFKYPVEDIDLLADEFGTSEQKVRTIICNYGLFDIDEEQNFFSLRFNEFMRPYLRMKQQRSIAGKKSAEARKIKKLEQPSTGVKASDEQRKVKESKVKESKVKKIFIIPTIEDIRNYCMERNNNVDPDKWFSYYTSNGWMVGRNKMKDWKAAVRTWEKNSYNNSKSTFNKNIDTLKRWSENND